jgi:hypothetical protein
LDAREHLNSDEESNWDSQEVDLDLKDDSDGIEQGCSEKQVQQSKDEDMGHKASLENIRQEADRLTQRRIEKVLNFLGLDSKEYHAINLYSDEDGHWRGTRVVKRTEVEGAESDYESENQSTIADSLEWGQEYHFGNDNEFENGIRDEYSTHLAEVAFKHIWELGWSAVFTLHYPSYRQSHFSLQET